MTPSIADSVHQRCREVLIKLLAPTVCFLDAEWGNSRGLRLTKDSNGEFVMDMTGLRVGGVITQV
jgi:hypothetical protein